MSDETSPTRSYYDLGLGVPLWVVIVWTAAGIIVVAMVTLVIYVCVIRKKGHGHDRAIGIEERRNSDGLFDIYPVGIIDQLHPQEINAYENFSPTFTRDLRIPRAVPRVRISESPEFASSPPQVVPLTVYEPKDENGNEASLNPRDIYLDLRSLEYELPASISRVAVSREASFRQAANISDENRAEQMYREKMVVNELRQKLRNSRRITEEDF
ncbi:uncharacterized protein LOC116611658 [Nematostella vectensis]|uniref:uncharacterized protein LOC116611658 n=1 Tax=Nematostella vectensis TaxID=45351 RepID=UPI0013900C51|nr:uncharacterized protein LOC116611658 [Nematostella vectensis]